MLIPDSLASDNPQHRSKIAARACRRHQYTMRHHNLVSDLQAVNISHSTNQHSQCLYLPLRRFYKLKIATDMDSYSVPVFPISMSSYRPMGPAPLYRTIFSYNIKGDYTAWQLFIL